LAWSIAYALQTCRLSADFRGARQVAISDKSRFEKIRPLLPGHGSVGYIQVVEPAISAVPDYWPRLYLAQFVLAPVILRDDPRAPMVLGDFRSPSAYPQAPPGIEYHIIVDCGNGVKLYQTRAAP
jgi:hypothetical protein